MKSIMENCYQVNQFQQYRDTQRGAGQIERKLNGQFVISLAIS